MIGIRLTSFCENGLSCPNVSSRASGIIRRVTQEEQRSRQRFPHRGTAAAGWWTSRTTRDGVAGTFVFANRETTRKTDCNTTAACREHCAARRGSFMRIIQSLDIRPATISATPAKLFDTLFIATRALPHTFTPNASPPHSSTR